jgi:uncharacterized protein
MIRETIVTTIDAAGKPHLAPLGVIAEGEAWILAPFHPSTTLENLRQAPEAVANLTDDVRIFAGCLTGRRDWPLAAARLVKAPRLRDALAHLELSVVEVRDDPQRPRFVCKVVHEETHGPFRGFNRAQNAVVEGAILISRLHMIPRAEIEQELDRLEIVVGKTAGPVEHEAWGWLREKAARHFAEVGTGASGAGRSGP